MRLLRQDLQSLPVWHSNKLNPQAESFKPRTETSTKGASEPKSGADLNQAFVDMTNFMTKKSFIMDRVKPFTGDSEHYLGWKATFPGSMCGNRGITFC